MVTSYEAGLKSEFLDHRALFDVSVYYIDWTDIVVPPSKARKRRNGQVAGRGTRQLLLAAAGAEARAYRGIHTMRVYRDGSRRRLHS